MKSTEFWETSWVKIFQWNCFDPQISQWLPGWKPVIKNCTLNSITYFIYLHLEVIIKKTNKKTHINLLSILFRENLNKAMIKFYLNFINHGFPAIFQFISYSITRSYKSYSRWTIHIMKTCHSYTMIEFLKYIIFMRMLRRGALHDH